jgi:Xaa-Pro aminopeptidase
MSDQDLSFPDPDVSEDHPESEHWIWVNKHRPPMPRPFEEFMTQQWADTVVEESPHPAVHFTAQRRREIQSRFPGQTLVIPTGGPKVRANDTDYPFRPGSDFFWLTACDDVNAVLVIHPLTHDRTATLYLEDRRDHSTHRYFSDGRYGEMWVGPRRGSDESARRWGIEVASRELLEKDLVASDRANVVVLRGHDDDIDLIVPAKPDDARLSTLLSDLRLIKDDYEIARLREAVDITVLAFEDVVRALPTAVGSSERVIEGIFHLRARTSGNDDGYGTIAAAGAHATILHWTRNDGDVRLGDLLLLDAGVEGHDLYTADVTRTMPISGAFSPEQREIYELVLAAADAGIEAVRPGAHFRDPHKAAVKVLAQGLFDLGILPIGPEQSMRKELPMYSRYMPHGTSHMLGIDVHDCANARYELYPDGELVVGNVLTVEPGLYLKTDDLTVPEKYRGIGVRIEDDVVVTTDGCTVLSAALPRTPNEIESWMRDLFAMPAPNLGL